MLHKHGVVSNKSKRTNIAAQKFTFDDLEEFTNFQLSQTNDFCDNFFIKATAIRESDYIICTTLPELEKLQEKLYRMLKETTIAEDEILIISSMLSYVEINLARDKPIEFNCLNCRDANRVTFYRELEQKNVEIASYKQMLDEIIKEFNFHTKDNTSYNIAILWKILDQQLLALEKIESKLNEITAITLDLEDNIYREKL